METQARQGFGELKIWRTALLFAGFPLVGTIIAISALVLIPSSLGLIMYLGIFYITSWPVLVFEKLWGLSLIVSSGGFFSVPLIGFKGFIISTIIYFLIGLIFGKTYYWAETRGLPKSLSFLVVILVFYFVYFLLGFTGVAGN